MNRSHNFPASGRRRRPPGERALFVRHGLFTLVAAVMLSAAAQAGEPAARTMWFASWQQPHRSTEGRPIETMRIGRGEFRTLVLGSLHGSETMAVAVTARLAMHLGRQADHWDEVNVLIVHTPNPDGLARRSSGNARGIDLNRNFPRAGNRQSPRDPRAGAADFSEIETRVVRQLIATYRPHRIVHVKATRNRSGWVLCNRQARAAADYLDKFRNLRVGRLEEHMLAGSVESHATGVLNVEAITLAVPQHADEDRIWNDHRNALLAAVAYVDPQWKPNSRPRPAIAATIREEPGSSSSFLGSDLFGRWKNAIQPDRSSPSRPRRPDSRPSIPLWPRDEQ